MVVTFYVFVYSIFLSVSYICRVINNDIMIDHTIRKLDRNVLQI